MNTESFVLESRPISIASYTNYKEAVFLISVLDEPDAYGRIIPEDAGEEYHKTIIGFPIVAKLKKNVLGKPTDFGAHELVVTKDAKGKKHRKFGTTAIGSVVDAWIEEREVDGYEGTPKCILIKSKLWTSRFPEYFKVFDKLWDEGKVQSSWELTATDVEEKNGHKIYKVFEFIGNAILGKLKSPAVPGAGVIEYAELENEYDAELAEALEKDIADLDIENEEKEDFELAKKVKTETPVENTELENVVVSESVEATEGNTTDIASEENVDANEVGNDIGKPEVASLTEHDLYRRISEACRKAIECSWGYVSYWFPEEKTVWFKSCDGESELDYKLFTYEVVEDEVTVSDPQDVKLTVSIAEVNSVIAEKDNKIGTLTAELELKDSAVIKAGEKINALNVEISELRPFKEAAKKAEQERIEAEIAEAKESLKNNMLKTKLFTEEEIAEAEIAELIETRNESAIKTLIAERYIASFDKEDVVESASVEEASTSVASLETDDIDESASAYMTNLLKRK